MMRNQNICKKLASYVEEKIQSISSKNKFPQRLKSEVLAALLIADEYFTQKEKNAEIEGRMQHLLTVLEDRLEEEQSQ